MRVWKIYIAKKIELGQGALHKPAWKTWSIKENIDWDALTIKTTFYGLTIKIQKQSPIVVPGKRFSENMQQTYRRTLMPKCGFNRVALQLCNFIEIALRHGCSPINLLHIFRTPFPRNSSRWLPLKVGVTQKLIHIDSIPSRRSRIAEVLWKKLLRKYSKIFWKNWQYYISIKC